MTVSPDQIPLFRVGPVQLNATVGWTWVVMALLVGISLLVTRRLSSGVAISRGQNLLEVLVGGIREQIREASQRDPDRYLPFVGTLFLFIAVSNILAIIPWFHPPTGSLSTTVGLAICVFIAVPVYGIRERGVGAYLRGYLQPTPLMLPFNIIGEISRTVALAVRLFGNVMSGVMIAATLLVVAPLLFPVILQVLGLLTGLVQAYIFSVLALVYIVSAEKAHEELVDHTNTGEEEEEVTHG